MNWSNTHTHKEGKSGIKWRVRVSSSEKKAVHSRRLSRSRPSRESWSHLSVTRSVIKGSRAWVIIRRRRRRRKDRHVFIFKKKVEKYFKVFCGWKQNTRGSTTCPLFCVCVPEPVTMSETLMDWSKPRHTQGKKKEARISSLSICYRSKVF